jgi:hypothetical protein
MNNIWILRVWCLFVIILFFIFSCSEDQPEIIARVGGSYITVSEFRDRFQFTPQLADVKNNKLAKRQLLNVMLAEKLLAEDVKRNGTAEADYNKLFSEQFQREAIIEKFWEDEIVSQVEVSEQDIQNAYEYSKRKYIINYLIYPDNQTASKDYSLIMQDESFEQIAMRQGYNAAEIPCDTVVFSGKLPEIEKAVFGMKINAISLPVREGKYYFIFKLVNVIERLSDDQNEFEKRRKQIEKILRNRSILDKFQQYKSENFDINTYQLDRTIFRRVTQQLEHRIFENGYKKDQNIDYEFREKIPLMDRSKLSELRHLKVVKFSDEFEWTVEELLNRLSIAPYPIDLETRGTFRRSMIAGAKRLLDDELIVLHGEKIGLSKTDFVKTQQRIWSDCLYATKELVNIINKGKLELKNNPDKKWLRQYLEERSQAYEIELNHSILDTLSLNNRADMIVIKKHFPLRSIVPSIPSLWINSDLVIQAN